MPSPDASGDVQGVRCWHDSHFEGQTVRGPFVAHPLSDEAQAARREALLEVLRSHMTLDRNAIPMADDLQRVLGLNP